MEGFTFGIFLFTLIILIQNIVIIAILSAIRIEFYSKNEVLHYLFELNENVLLILSNVEIFYLESNKQEPEKYEDNNELAMAEGAAPDPRR